MENHKNKSALIYIDTNDNRNAAKVLDFFELEVSGMDKYMIVKYEDVDQVPAICRLLVDAAIDINEIFII